MLACQNRLSLNTQMLIFEAYLFASQQSRSMFSTVTLVLSAVALVLSAVAAIRPTR